MKQVIYLGIFAAVAQPKRPHVFMMQQKHVQSQYLIWSIVIFVF